MATLLHIDSSLRHEGSVSREVTASFADHWRAANPDGEYVYRDLTANPVPHLTASTYFAAFTPEDELPTEQAAAWAARKALIDELLSADVVLLGVPMYNFSVPDRFKSWLDHVISPLIAPNQETGAAPLADKRFVVVHSRGGAYGPGTPREDFDFQEKYLRKVFVDFLGVEKVTFLLAEMTAAHIAPALAEFKHLADQSLAEAHNTAKELATAAA